MRGRQLAEKLLNHDIYEFDAEGRMIDPSLVDAADSIRFAMERETATILLHPRAKQEKKQAPIEIDPEGRVI